MKKELSFKFTSPRDKQNFAENKSKVYREGFESFRNLNPYKKGTWQHAIWEEGYYFSHCNYLGY